MKIKNNIIRGILSAVITVSLLTGCQPAVNTVAANDKTVSAITSNAFEMPEVSEDAKNFYVVNDLGRNGYYSQKKIAELMGTMAEKVDIDFIAALGDTHHFDGVASTADPLWLTNYESIYSHPELMTEWYAICGNHEYRGNTQAVIDYSKISRRWNMPSYYYSKTVDGGENQKALLVFIDTTPLISKYRQENDIYPDTKDKNEEEQLKWIDKTLKESDAKWKIVMGHHPVYAQTTKSETERTELQQKLKPILEKNNVDAYLAGHIHSFQHIRPNDSKVDYFVNSSGSLSRKVSPVEGTKFCSPDAGYMIVSMEDNKLKFFMINENGNIIYSYNKEK